MSRTHHAGRVAALAVSIALAMAGALAIAQPPGLLVTPLLRTDLSGDPAREVVVVKGEFAPGASTGRHTHPGDEYATVVEGVLEVVFDGHPPRRYAAGEAYHNTRGLAHETRNVGDSIARVVSTFIVDKGRPIIERAESVQAD